MAGGNPEMTSSRRLRWSVMVMFEVEGDSIELALEAAKQSLVDFPRPVLSVHLNESHDFNWVSG